MASIRCLTVNHRHHHHHPRLSSSSSSKPSKSTTQVVDKAEQVVRVSVPISSLISRRCAILITWLPLSLISASPPSEARERRNRKVIPLEDYRTTPADGLKYYDLVEGKGPVAEKGSTVEVHFDCLYRGITAVSSRESKLLAGNRSIAQVLNFTFVGVLRASACSYHAQPLF
ncbi:unnamed protein product [Prunus armeniaca]